MIILKFLMSITVTIIFITTNANSIITIYSAEVVRREHTTMSNNK